MRKRAVVICPGRGSYNAPELGSLTRDFPDAAMLARFDRIRETTGQATLTALDGAETYQPARHSKGDAASPLIFAGGLGDSLCLDPAKVEVVAVTGNSMGWYTALAVAGAVSPETGFEIANAMGTLMDAEGQGGQLVYPHMSTDWRPDPDERARLLALVGEIDSRPAHRLALSIDLGGVFVLAGNEAGLQAFEGAVPARNQMPFRLPYHAAFHTDLVSPISDQGLATFSTERFGQPQLPMIDGRGHVWWPKASNPAGLRHYTLGTQVTEPYDFARAIQTAAREFAPDLFILTGPGSTLGGAVGQSLVGIGWAGLVGKKSFDARQDTDPVLVSMGRKAQRALVTA